MTPDTRYALEMKYTWTPFFYSLLSSRASASVQAGTCFDSTANVSHVRTMSGSEITEDPSASGDGSAAKEAYLLRAKEAQPGLSRVLYGVRATSSGRVFETNVLLTDRAFRTVPHWLRGGANTRSGRVLG